MIEALKFFIHNLTNRQIFFGTVIFFLHIGSYLMFLDTEKFIIKNISKIIVEENISFFSSTIFDLLFRNIGYLFIYGLTMFLIENIGKIAIKKAVDNSCNKLLNVDLSKVTKKEYEHNVLSIVHHSENINSVTRNLFIEFPRKIIASWHFIVAIKELSVDLMIYCFFANIVFVLLNTLISNIRKKILEKLTESNIKFTVLSSDVCNSIQSHKIDNRIAEYNNKIKAITSDIWYDSSCDSLMIACNDSLTNFSAQFMIGMISYLCKPNVIAGKISIEDLMYGIRSSSKFIEKIGGIFEYIGDVVRQYKSFEFYSRLNKFDQEIVAQKKLVTDIKIKNVDSSENLIINLDSMESGRYIRISGENGAGKTTSMLEFLGVKYAGAKSNCKIQAFKDIIEIEPLSYRKSISYVQQNIPITSDTVSEYFKAVTGSYENIDLLILQTYKLFAPVNLDYISNFIKKIGKDVSIRELSGGQAKFVQILASITKLYVNKGKILILDEPTNNLDTVKVDILMEILNQCINRKICVFIVTHDKRMLAFPQIETFTI